MIFRRFLIALFLWFFFAAGSEMSVLTVSEDTAIAFPPGTLLGISSGKKAAITDTETTSGPHAPGQPGRIVLDYLQPTLLRYPLGTKSNYWNPAYYPESGTEKPGYRLLSYWQPGQPRSAGLTRPPAERYFDHYLMDEQKLLPRFASNNRERDEEPLQDLVDFALLQPQPATITFVCNMVTPGADYFYHHDTEDGGLTADASPPRRIDRYPATRDSYPLYPYEKDQPEPHLWWRHMKWRAFACLHMLQSARTAGLPTSAMRVELGNELYLENNPYVLEVFPPDMRFWYDMISAMSPEEKAHYGIAKGVAERFYVVNDSLIEKIREHYLARNRYHVSTRAKVSAAETGVQPSADDIIDIAGKLPPDDSYAYAAVYFADLIRNFTEAGGEKPFAAVPVAAIKSSSLAGYTQHTGPDGSRRIALWDSLILPAIRDLDQNHADPGSDGDPQTRRIDALAEHDYLFSPRYCYGGDIDAWTGANIRDQLRRKEPDPMGVLARAYEFERQKVRLGDENCPGQSCLGQDHPPYPVWHTEYAFDFLHHGHTVSRWSESLCSNEAGDSATPPCQMTREEWDDSWAHALANAYMTSALLAEAETASLIFFEVATLLPWGSDDGFNSDATADVLALWFDAVAGSDSRARLAFEGEDNHLPGSLPFTAAQNPQSCETDTYLTEFSPQQEPAGELPALSGWRFDGKQADGKGRFSRYLLLNLKAASLDLRIETVMPPDAVRVDTRLQPMTLDLSSAALPLRSRHRMPLHAPVHVPARSLVMVEFSYPEN